MFFRSIKNLGATRTLTTNNIVALGGMDQHAICVELVEHLVMADYDFDASNLRYYKKVRMPRNWRTSPRMETEPMVNHQCLLSGSFFRTDVISARSNEPLKLIPVAIHAGEESDR